MLIAVEADAGLERMFASPGGPKEEMFGAVPSAPELQAFQVSNEEFPHFGLWSSPELFALQRALSIQKSTPAFKPPASCRCLRALQFQTNPLPGIPMFSLLFCILGGERGKL